jgi:hypothetical protein
MAPELQDFKTITVLNGAKNRQNRPTDGLEEAAYNAFSYGCCLLLFRLSAGEYQPFGHPVVGAPQSPVELSIIR